MFIIFPPSYPGEVDRNQGQSAPMKYSECSDVMNIGEMWKSWNHEKSNMLSFDHTNLPSTFIVNQPSLPPKQNYAPWPCIKKQTIPRAGGRLPVQQSWDSVPKVAAFSAAHKATGVPQRSSLGWFKVKHVKTWQKSIVSTPKHTAFMLFSSTNSIEFWDKFVCN